MTTRRDALVVRRRALQAECQRQREDAGALYGDIAGRAARVDGVVAIARSLTPVIAVGGAVALLVIGPGRVLRLLRNALPIALYAIQARSLLATSLRKP